MVVFDTNVLVYAVDEDSPFHERCRKLVSRARSDASPAFVTWSICYEFLRVTTHARAPIAPWTLPAAWAYLEMLLARGNLAHDLHTAVLMREHGISRICTRDTDFRRFPFLTVVDPLM